MADWNFGGEEGFYLLNNLSGENRWEEGNSLLSAYNTKLFLVKPTVFPNGTQTISTPKQTLAENNIYFLKIIELYTAEEIPNPTTQMLKITKKVLKNTAVMPKLGWGGWLSATWKKFPLVSVL